MNLPSNEFSGAPSSRLPSRVLLAFVATSILGLAAISILAYRNVTDLQRTATRCLDESRNIAVSRCTVALDKLGEQLIRQKAEHVAAQVGLYLAEHPAMTVRELQQDPKFQEIAVQPIGENGYTALADYDTLVNRFHKSPKIVDLDLSSLSEKLPGFWQIMKATSGGRAAGGYYDWEDADGSRRRKYMWIAIVPRETTDHVGMNVAATTYIDDFSRPSAELGQAMTTAAEAAVERLRRQGERYSRRVLIGGFVVLLIAGALFGLMAVLVTRFRRALQARTDQLRTSEQLYRNVYDTAPLAFVIWDTQCRVTGWNECAERMFGWTRDEVMGHNFFDFLIPKHLRPCLEDVSRSILQGRVASGIVNENLTKSGRLIICQWNNSVLFSESGLPIGAISLALDITDRERSQQELERAKNEAEAANCAKSEFLANMSHEIRTPMTAILGYADILLEDSDLDKGSPEHREAARIIRRNGEHLLGIINDILDISKIEAGRMTVEQIRCSPCNLLAEVLSLMRVRADSKGLSLAMEYKGAIPETLQTDPTRLRQILMNVIANAIKFTEVGEIRIAVGMESAADQSMMFFDVRDSGIGMCHDQVGRLFQPFMQADNSTTRRFGGTGLGLAISRRFAQMLGGDIELVETRPNAGSRFRITIATGPLDGIRMIEDPVAAVSVKPTTEAAQAPGRTAGLRGYRILLAEDGPDNQRLISHLLRQAGAEVVVVDNGRAAMEAALAAGAADEPYQVILMDVQMPIMDGHEAVRRLRDAGYDAPIIALTAHAKESDRQASMEAGCNGHATKPVERRSLIEMVRACCGESNFATQNAASP